MPDPTAHLSYAFGAPAVSAVARHQPGDFRVEEVLSFAPAGEGGHALLRIRKRGLNTREVARMLADLAGVRPVSVGFAGMKDRNAVTEQWFSVDLMGRREPDWGSLESGALSVIEATRHPKKLRRGQIAENRFRIVLRRVEGGAADIGARLDRIAAQGVPNYFGPQRFGRRGANLQAAARMFGQPRRRRDRRLGGIYLSAARAQIFNRALSARVSAGTWNRALPGDVLMFDDSRSRFPVQSAEISDDPRIAALELHPTGPLWGRGAPGSGAGVAELEREAAAAEAVLAAGLESAGVDADRRALRLRVRDLDHAAGDGAVFELGFALRAGGFATAVLREAAAIRAPRND